MVLFRVAIDQAGFDFTIFPKNPVIKARLVPSRDFLGNLPVIGVIHIINTIQVFQGDLGRAVGSTVFDLLEIRGAVLPTLL